MTLLSFHRLAPLEQQDHVLNTGTHLMTRQEPKYLINLYAVDGFYVELFFYRKHSQAVKINAFESTSLLESYLDDINLSELFSPH